jgi:hypothetical protein
VKFGRNTRYQLIKLEPCVYVDKTGCSINMKNDGNVGERGYVMGLYKLKEGSTSVVSGIDFTVLAFTSGTGEVILCSISIKSDKDVADLPISWKL